MTAPGTDGAPAPTAANRPPRWVTLMALQLALGVVLAVTWLALGTWITSMGLANEARDGSSLSVAMLYVIGLTGLFFAIASIVVVVMTWRARTVALASAAEGDLIPPRQLITAGWVAVAVHAPPVILEVRLMFGDSGVGGLMPLLIAIDVVAAAVGAWLVVTCKKERRLIDGPAEQK